MSRWLITSGVWQPFKEELETNVIVIHRDKLDIDFVKRVKSIFDRINAEDQYADYHINSWRDFYEFVFAQGHTGKSDDAVFETFKSELKNKGLEEGTDYTVETMKERQDYFNSLPEDTPFEIKTPKEKEFEEQERIRKENDKIRENEIYKQIQIKNGELPFGKE